MEIERLRRHCSSNGTGRPLSQKKSAISMDEHIAGLEQDRDYWKGQVELLTQMLASPTIAGPRNTSNKQGGNRVSSASKVSRGVPQRDERKSKVMKFLAFYHFYYISGHIYHQLMPRTKF